jgi:hypothetical protein
MPRVKLSNGRGYALVSSEDLAKVSRHSWRLGSDGYALSTVNGKSVRMHQFVMGRGRGDVIDHVNGDKLDNRRRNLRVATTQENSRNRPAQSNNKAGYKGVRFKEGRGWSATIYDGSAQKHIGYYPTAKAAAAAYDAEARKLFGKFANVNGV